MKESNLRTPTQKRAIKKKEKILENGFKLMCKQGYHNTDAIQIAKAAGVSTGTVYQYYKDKKDIFYQGLKEYAKDLMFPIINIEIKEFSRNNIKSEIKELIKYVINRHTISNIAHKEITAMECTDSEIFELFEGYELEATETLIKLLEVNKVKTENLYEKAHLIHSWIDNLCHEVVYHKHDNMNYDKMIDLVAQSIIDLLK